MEKQGDGQAKNWKSGGEGFDAGAHLRSGTAQATFEAGKGTSQSPRCCLSTQTLWLRECRCKHS